MRSRPVPRPTNTLARWALLCALILAVLASSASAVRAEGAVSGEVFASEERNRVFEYHYNSDFLFGVTRGVAGSDMHLAAKIPLYLFSFPTDTVLLPIEALAGRESGYLFGVTRGVAGSDMHLAFKIPLYLFTFPADIVLLPYAGLAELSG